jgi:hypothetical protein
MIRDSATVGERGARKAPRCAKPQAAECGPDSGFAGGRRTFGKLFAAGPPSQTKRMKIDPSAMTGIVDRRALQQDCVDHFNRINQSKSQTQPSSQEGFVCLMTPNFFLRYGNRYRKIEA